MCWSSSCLLIPMVGITVKQISLVEASQPALTGVMIADRLIGIRAGLREVSEDLSH